MSITILLCRFLTKEFVMLTSALRKHKLMTHENKTPTTLRSSPEGLKKTTETTQNEVDKFFKTISEDKTKPSMVTSV